MASYAVARRGGTGIPFPLSLDTVSWEIKMIRVSCPKCKTVLQVQDKHAGQVIACSNCKTSLRLPQARSAPPPPPQVDAVSDAPASPSPAPTAEDRVEKVSKLAKTTKDLIEVVKTVGEGHSWVVMVLVPALPTFGGMIGDFLRPIGPFNFLVFFLSFLVAVSLIVLFMRRPKTLTYTLGGTCAFSSVMALGFGAWWILSAVGGGQGKGVLANNIGFVDHLQAKVVRGESVVTEQKIEGKKVAEEIHKEIEAETNTEKLLHIALDGYPANVVKGEVTGKPKRKPGSGNAVEYDLTISVDIEQYETVTKKLLATLDKVALQKGESFAKGAKSQTIIRGKFNIDGRRIGEWGEGDWGWQEWKSNTPQLPKDDDHNAYKNKMFIVVNTARSGADERTTWRWFQVARIEKLFKHGRVDDVNQIEVTVLFLDKGKNEVSRDQFVVAGDMIPGLFSSQNYGSNIFQAEIVSPYIRDDRHYCSSMKTKRAITFSASELEKVDTIRCSVKAR